MDRLDEVYRELDAIGAAGAEARARSILYGLGFEDSEQDRPTQLFSGNWLLFVDLLLLSCRWSFYWSVFWSVVRSLGRSFVQYVGHSVVLYRQLTGVGVLYLPVAWASAFRCSYMRFRHA